MRFDFLICSERSGSNLITKLLDSHPEVCGPFPSHMVRTFSLNLNGYGDLNDDAAWSTLLDDAVFYINRIISLWKSDFRLEEVRNAVEKRSLDAVIRHFYETEARANGKKRVFVEENHTYSILAYLLSHFEGSKYIYTVRDPRDMALTWKEAVPAQGQVPRAAKQWKKDQVKSLEAYGFLKDLDRIHLVKYENLVTDTEKTVRRICSFLDLEYSGKMLRFHEKDIVRENSQRIVSWKDLQKPIMPENAGRYKIELSEDEIRYIECLCRKEMDTLGYKRQFDEAGEPEALEKKLLPEDMSNRLTDTEKEIYASFKEAVGRVQTRNLPLRSS